MVKAKYFGASFQGGQTGFHNQAQACLHPWHSSFVPPAVGRLANNQDKLHQDLAAPCTEKEQRVIFTILNFVNFLRKFLSHKEVLKRQWSFAEFATLEMKDDSA